MSWPVGRKEEFPVSGSTHPREEVRGEDSRTPWKSSVRRWQRVLNSESRRPGKESLKRKTKGTVSHHRRRKSMIRHYDVTRKTLKSLEIMSSR